MLSDAQLKLGGKLKTFVAAESGKITEHMTFERATVVEFHKFVANKAKSERVDELFEQVCLKKCSTLVERNLLIMKF